MNDQLDVIKYLQGEAPAVPIAAPSSGPAATVSTAEESEEEDLDEMRSRLEALRS